MTLSVNEKEEHFQIDTRATVNVMPDMTLSKLCGNADQLESFNTTLLMYCQRLNLLEGKRCLFSIQRTTTCTQWNLSLSKDSVNLF